MALMCSCACFVVVELGLAVLVSTMLACTLYSSDSCTGIMIVGEGVILFSTSSSNRTAIGMAEPLVLAVVLASTCDVLPTALPALNTVSCCSHTFTL
jgi:hypothetical protein